MWYVVVNCVYCFLAGSLLLIVCFLYGFDVTMSVVRLLSSVMQGELDLRRRLRQPRSYPIPKEMLEGLTGATGTVPAMTFSCSCYVASYHPETKTAGEYLPCRFSLSGTDVRVYQLLFAGGSDQKAEARKEAEHYKGLIPINSVVVVRRKVALPSHLKSGSSPAGRRLFISTKHGGSMFGGSTNSNYLNTLSASGPNLSPPDGTPAVSPVSGVAGGSLASTTGSLDMSAMARGSLGEYVDGGAWSLKDSKEVVLEFKTALDAERLYTIIQSHTEAERWRQFTKDLPNPDTFNLALARLLYPNFRRDGLERLLQGAIRKALAEVPEKKFPRFITGDIFLDDFVLGGSFPCISDVSEPTFSTNGELGFDFNLRYKGEERGFALYFKVAINFRGIRVPHFIISLKIMEVQATLHISIGPPPSGKVWIGLHRPPIIRVRADQGCASGKGFLHRLLSIPDMSGIFANLLRVYAFSEMLLPEMDDFALPSVEKPEVAAQKKKAEVFDRRRAAKRSRRYRAGVSVELTEEEEAERLAALESLAASDFPGPLDTTQGGLDSWHSSSQQQPLLPSETASQSSLQPSLSAAPSSIYNHHQHTAKKKSRSGPFDRLKGTFIKRRKKKKQQQQQSEGLRDEEGLNSDEESVGSLSQADTYRVSNASLSILPGFRSTRARFLIEGMKEESEMMTRNSVVRQRLSDRRGKMKALSCFGMAEEPSGCFCESSPTPVTIPSVVATAR